VGKRVDRRQYQVSLPGLTSMICVDSFGGPFPTQRRRSLRRGVLLHFACHMPATSQSRSIPDPEAMFVSSRKVCYPVASSVILRVLRGILLE
jgi:hypothetical protein